MADLTGTSDLGENVEESLNYGFGANVTGNEVGCFR